MKYTKHILVLALAVMANVTIALAEVSIQKHNIDRCMGDSFLLVLKDTVVYQSGIYDDTLYSEPDTSVNRYIVNFHPIEYTYQTRLLMIGTSFEWFGQTIDKAGIYHTTLKSQYLCDSVLSLQVIYTYPDPTHLVKTDTTICQGESCTWQGETYTEEGIYYKKYTAHDGQDSVHVLNLRILPVSITIESKIFNSFPFWYRDSLLPAPGTYDIHYASTTGCDSIVRVVANLATTVVEETASICKGTAYLWHGQTIVAPGIYQDIVKKLSDPTQDSIIYQLKAELIDPIRVERQATICMGDSLIINEGTPSRRVFTRPGIHLDTLKASSTDCDSIVTWIINANPTQLITSEVIWGSDQGPYLWQGRELTASGTYDTVYKNINGCDSTYRLKLTIGSVYRFDTTVYVCSHDLPFIWRGNTYYTAGDYTPFSGKTVQGLDSTLTIHVRITQPSLTPISATICSEEHYVFKGRQLTTPGVYYDTLANAAGCDSIVMLSLNTFNKDTITEYARIAQGQTYLWQGDTLTEAHVYTKTYPSIHGCDSVRRLILSVFETYTFDTVATVCQAQLPFRWHGIEGTQTNTYRKNYVTQQGYDSTYVLHLTVIPTPVVRINKSICKSQTFTFGGKTLSETGVYTDTLHHDGCDSIIILSLNVMEVDTIYEVHRVDEGQTYRYQGVDYVAPQSKEFHYENQYGCDSIVKLVLTVHQVDTIDTTAVICAANRPLIWHGIEGRQTNTYTNIEETPTGNQIVYVMHLTVHEAAHTHIYDNACSGTSYQFGHQYLTQTGTYYDTLTTVYGCDSIVELSLNVFAADTVEETHHIAQGSFFEWRDSVYRTPGIHEKQVKTENNCLRYYRLHLYVHPIYNIDSTVSICANNAPLEWHGIKAYTTGTYHLTYKTVDGYDSIYTLNLTVYPEIPVTHINASICMGSSYIFGEEELTETGTYRHTYKSVNGCDSIVELTLNVFDEGIMRVEKQIAQGDSVVWHGVTYKTPGVFTIHEETEQGCTQTYELTLHVYSTFHHKDSVTICSNEIPYEWHGQKYLETGVYYESFKTVHGYDSTYTLDLTVLPPVEVPVYLKICDNQSVTFLGRQYDSKGTYFDKRGCDTTYKIIVTQLPIEIYTTYAVFDGIHPYIWSFNGKAYPNAGIYDEKFTSVLTGCDSIYRLDLKRDHKFLSEETKVICEGDGFVWRGQQLSLTGVGETKVYYDRLKTISGLDSVYKLTLTVRPVVHSEQTLTFCDQITISGRTYTQSTTVTDTLTSFQYGCDSIVTYHLNRQYGYHFHDTITIMSGESITWRGQTITSEGTHFARFTSVNGCDSIYSLGVGVIPAPEQKYVISTRTIICENDSVEWRGKWIYSAGIYYDSLRTKDDLYDSIYVIHVESRPIYRFTKHLYTCHEGSIAYNGHIYTQSGIYQDTMKTLQGCDSIATLHIHIDASYFHSDTLRASNRDTIEWHGQKIYISGTYTDRHVSPTGCDSIWELVAEIYPTYLFERDTAVCQCETPFLWRGRMIGELGFHTYDTVYRTIHGYDSIYRLNVTVYPQYEQEQQINYCEGGSVLFREKEYNQPGVDTIKLKTIHNCDSFIIVHVNKLPRYHLSEVRTLLEGDTIFWHNDTITQPGTYYDKGYTIAGCDSTYEITVNRIIVDSTIIQICQVDTPYTWRGHNYYVSTERMEVLKDSLGNDSAIFRLKLTVNENYITRESYSFCEGENFFFNGKLYKNMGADSTAMDTIHYTTKDHCDSTVIVTIRENPKKISYETRTILDGDTIFWHNDTITQPGVYRDKQQTTLGCDSTFQLTVNRIKVDSTIIQICQADTPYTWRGNNYYVSTERMEVLKDTLGNDSAIFRLRLTVNQNYITRESYTFCEGESYTYNGKTYFQMGADSVAMDTVHYTTRDHCDSTIIVAIRENPKKYEKITKIIHDGDSILWEGETIRNAGRYTKTYEQAFNGCDSIIELNVVVEQADTILDWCQKQPYTWRLFNGQDTSFYRNEVYVTDTAFDAAGYIIGFKSLHLEMRPLIDTTIYMRGCMTEGVTYNDVIYKHDTLVNDTLPTCDTIFHLYVKIDTVYNIVINDTVCEYELPYVLGRQKPDTIWQEGSFTHKDTTACGCDSTIILTLRIIPDLHKNDSIIICERDIEAHPVILGNLYDPNRPIEQLYPDYMDYKHLGDTVHQPKFANLYPDWREWTGIYGPWKGIEYHEDTIVWNCDSSYFFHVIVKPQPIKDSLYYLCEGDSIRFGYNWKDGSERWIKTAGQYWDSIASPTSWVDTKHGNRTYDTDTIQCDSLIRLNVIMLPSYHKDTTAHIPMGDSIWWGHKYEYYTGDYDSIINTNREATSGEYCHTIYTLHLFVDSTYHYRDTINICSDSIKTLSHVWADGHIQYFNTPGIDTTLHYIENIRTAEYHFDSIYDLRVNFHNLARTNIHANICKGDSVQFGFTNNGQPRWIYDKGIYRDTLLSHNQCDSIITLTINWHQSYFESKTIDISDKQVPYLWLHTQGQDTIIDTLYATGTYTHAYKDLTFGCDSILELVLNVHKTYLFKDSIEICQDQTPYTWLDENGVAIKTDIYQSGLYRHSLLTHDGYDSIYERKVTVWPVVYDTVHQNICYGHSVLFKGQYITEQGTYVDTLTSAHGCDSILTMIVTVNMPYEYTIREDIYEGASYTFFGQEYSATGLYKHEGRTPAGCDSITWLHLTVHPVFDTTVTICHKQLPYIWVNKWTGDTTILRGAGIYHDNSHFDEQGNRLFYGIRLIVPEERDTTINHTICQESFYDFHGRKLTEAGVYRDTLVSSLGCDSIVTLNLTVAYPYYQTEKVDIITGGYTIFFGDTLRETGTYTHLGVTPAGCDSTSILQLTVHPLFDTTATICYSDLPYAWVNKWTGATTLLYKEGIYRDDSTIVEGQRMYYGLRLIVNRGSDTTIYHSMCRGDAYLFNGKDLTTEGIYRDTIKAANGCDSVITLDLRINDPYYQTQQVDIIQGGYTVFYGDTLREANTYYHFGRTPDGCDSTTVLQLTVHPLYDTIVTICYSDLPYAWVNKWTGETTLLYKEGNYRNDTTFVNGQRMFYGLQLVVNRGSDTTIYHSMCRESFYEFNGVKLYEAGTYKDTLKNVNACDSVITLRLSVNEPYYQTNKIDILEGASYPFYGEVYDKTGTYYHYALTPDGCDSTTVLQLTVHKLVDTTVTVCYSDLPYAWVNKWTGETTLLYKEGNYRNDTTIVDGQRMFYGLQLNVNRGSDTTIYHSMCRESFYEFNGVKLYEAGTYKDTLKNVNSCDSVITLHLRVNEPYYQTQKIDILEGASYPFYGEVYDKTGTYYHYALTPDGCDSTTVLQLTVHKLVDTTVTVCYSDLPYAWVNKWTGETTLLYKEGNYRNDTTIVDGQRMFYGLQLNVNRGSDTTIYHSMCRESFYEFNGVKLYEAGTYKDTLKNVNSCDSVITLHLRVNEPYYQTQKIDILEGASYPFYGEVYDKTGTYYHYALTPDGCDSTTILQLTVHKLVDTTVTVCYSDLPYAWVNKWTGETTLLYKEGNYRNDTTIVDGQRMFYGLQLNVNRGSDTTIYHSMCRESFYEFNGVKLYEAGTYKDTLKNVNSCDSVITLHLRVNEPYYQTQKIDILEGASYPFYGEVYDKTGTYYHYALTPDGCDSTTILQLTVHKLVDTTVTVCYSDLPYAWVNKWTGETTLLYKEGNYRNDTTIVDGQRMFYGLQLNVNRGSDTTIYHSMCRGSFHPFNGQDLYEEGTYKDTLRNINGCDSVITLHLRVNDPYYHTETVHIIEGGSTVFFGDTYTTAGTYYHYGITPDGCDSTSVLQLIVHKQIDSIATVCAKDLPYAWVNRWTGDTTWLHAAGIYRNDTTIVGGEKMFYGLQLVVNDESTSVLNRTICQGSSIEIDGHTFSEPGTYTYTIGNAKGCDSVITVNVVVQPNYHDYVYKDIFDGDTIWFYNQPYTTPGNYPVRETTVFGCDSIIELVLGVHKMYNDSISVCQNELPFVWTSPWSKDTIMIYRDGIYRDTIIDPVTGIKSIYSLKVTTRPIIHNDVPPTIQTICEGDFYIFNGQTLTTPGVYYDTLVAESNGCDSVIAIALQVMPSKSITFTKTIYEGEFVEFHGQQYGAPGTYEYRDKTQYGCDSIERLILNVLREAHLDTAAYVCDNELPFVWRGKEYWTTGKYQTAIESSTGKVMVTLNLTVRPTLYFERDLEFCEGSYLVYRGDTIRESGSFYDTIPAKNGGCDSVIKVTMAVHPKEHYQMSPVTISDQQSYNFFGRILRESGNYEYTTLSSHGCDSIIHLQLIVHPSYHFSDSVDLCRHELPYTYTWNKLANYHTTLINKDKPYYIDSFATVWGFDSIYSLKVNIYDDTFEEQNYTLKAGSSTTIRGIYIDTPGIYMDTLLTRHGCDSVIKMVINPASTVYNEWSPVTMCQGETYKWFGDNLTKSGSYYHKIESDRGDTIYHLNLVVHQPSLHEERIVICGDDVPYIHHGRAYYESTLITDSLKDVNGCDSIMRINLIISEHCSDWQQIPLCLGDTLFISGDTITEPGQYQYFKRSCKSCPIDSLYRIEVFKAPSFESPLIKVVTCSNDTFKVGGKPLLRSGLHDVVLKTIHGCDSIIHVDLTIHPAYFNIDTTITTVDYKPIVWRGNSYNTTGMHKVYFSTIMDCDSIHALDLFVIQTKRIVVDENICLHDTMYWRGRKLTEPGTYSDTILNYASHTSVIYTLNLGVVAPTFIRQAFLSDTCADAEEFYITFSYTGARPEKYSVYFDDPAHYEGFKDIIDKPFGQDIIAVVPMPKKTKVLYNEHNDYVKPGYYTMRLVLDNTVCGISRSDELSMIIRYPSWIIEQNWDNVVAPLAPKYNGGYQFGAYEWYINGVLFPNGGQNFLYTNTLRVDDQVVMKVTRLGDNYAIPTCPLTIKAAKPDVYDNPILITPSSAARQHAQVTIKSQEQGEYIVFSHTGHIIEKGYLEEGEKVLTLPSVAGCYIIQANTNTGFSITQKVLLY